MRMAADQERADRIRALKQERPDLTWRRIADHVGVTERSATDWQKKGGIDYDNAKKLAEIFEVDLEYLWRGTPEEDRAPTPFAGLSFWAPRFCRRSAARGPNARASAQSGGINANPCSTPARIMLKPSRTRSRSSSVCRIGSSPKGPDLRHSLGALDTQRDHRADVQNAGT